MKEYIGGGVFAETSGPSGIVLTTDNNSNTIYLEADALSALIVFSITSKRTKIESLLSQEQE